MTEHPTPQGQELLRAEDRRLVTGHGCYAADWCIDGSLHAHVLRSDRAHAVLGRIDTATASDSNNSDTHNADGDVGASKSKSNSVTDAYVTAPCPGTASNASQLSVPNISASRIDSGSWNTWMCSRWFSVGVAGVSPRFQ